MPIVAAYGALKIAANADLKGAGTRNALTNLVVRSLEFTAGAALVPLISKVPGKTYAMMAHDGKTSRPINTGLYRQDIPASDLLSAIFEPEPDADPDRLDQCLYTAAMSFPLASDLLGVGNQKSPGTFFEIFVGHIFARQFDVNPQKAITVPTLDIKQTIPTDYIFELGKDRRVHLPVKISTRERVAQVWAHQRLLEGMHGVGRFKGILVCLAETNKQKNASVTEVCVPHQWAAYQMYIGTISRVYYLDPPLKYLALRDTFPNIQVWPLSRFFFEAKDILNPKWA